MLLLVIGVSLVLANALLGSPTRLARRIGGTPADRVRDARLWNLAEGLCVTSGLPLPDLRILEDPSMNALVLGGDPSKAVLVCTSGLLASLDRMELEGLLSHELAHLRRGDAAVAELATRACGFWGLLFPGTARLVVHLAGREREAFADFAGARVTRYPPGLAGALTKIAAGPNRPAVIDDHLARLTGALWCARLEEAAPRSTVPGLLSLAERAAALSEL